MALYEYRCERDGAFDVRRPLGTAPATVACPVCAGAARRVFSRPMLGTTAPRELVGAIERAQKSRHEPEVVTSLPRVAPDKRTPVAPLTPTLRRLPRP
jgi:putative FmdB family regulatory protein